MPIWRWRRATVALPKNKPTKEQIYVWVKNSLLVTLGCLILAFGSAAFLVPAGLMTGGISSIGITIQYLLDLNGIKFQVIDIVTFGIEIILFFVGLAVLGWKFSAHTLWASIIYPGFFAIFYRTGWLSFVSDSLTKNFTEPFLGMFLCGLFGGVCVGAGVAVTFLGGGSTGGVDILVVIMAKFTPIKESFGTAITDYSIILIGIIVRYAEPNIIPIGLIGLVSAFIAALTIQILYVSSNSFITVEIISKEHQKIIDYINEKMDRGCTIYPATGGFTGEEKRVVKVALVKKEAEQLRNFISTIDDRAFMIVTASASVNGEGFVPFATPRVSLLKRFIVGKENKYSERDENGL